MERIVIPTNDDRGLDSSLCEHFGRAPYFTVVELGEDGDIKGISSIPNLSEHFGGSGRPPDAILRLKPDALITIGMGPRALEIFQRAGVAVLMANSNLVRDIIQAYKEDRLQELTEGCRQARHR
ncbi:NifB/NifX family molybdenum-iron cluster-binding protein [Candidatus Bathyarchaeota archaeon]|nr:NifB/NifX family molybdenum-iron cluster-binding protein [Candidatus Bathyarchaeota archaeon]